MRIELPAKVKHIIDTLNENGYDAYAVGGCVRDSVLGRVPDDWDITTPARPETVKKLFPRTIDTGIAHGTVTVMIDREGFEVTTYRVDGEYEDSRHPKEVVFTADLIKDLERRDFTVNAMAYNEKEGMVDAFGGLSDLHKGIIRCVGDPKERFSEDALRILRAVRFSAQLGFSIEEQTRRAIQELAPSLAKISAERIRTELVKLLVSPNPDRLLTAFETGITKVILPEYDAMMDCGQQNPHHIYSVGMHTQKAVEAVEPDKILRLTMLFHDIGKPLVKEADENGVDHFRGHEKLSSEMAGRILRRLRFDNASISRVCLLVKFHDIDISGNKKCVRRVVSKVSEREFPDLLKVKRADIEAQSGYKREEKKAALKRAEALFHEILSDGDCISLKTLAVTGKDLLAAGIKPGKEIGQTLNSLLSEVIEEPERNEREWLLKRAAEISYGLEKGSGE